jgi:hypothetical protein
VSGRAYGPAARDEHTQCVIHENLFSRVCQGTEVPWHRGYLGVGIASSVPICSFSITDPAR